MKDSEIWKIAVANRQALVAFAQKLVKRPSLPGQESDVARLVDAEMKLLGYDEVWVDEVGNVIGRIQGGDGDDVLILAYGTLVHPALEEAAELSAEGISAAVLNARFAKPLDEELLAEHLRRFDETFGAGGRVRAFFAPGRVNLVGAHLDDNGGPGMPLAIDRGTFLADTRRIVPPFACRDRRPAGRYFCRL